MFSPFYLLKRFFLMFPTQGILPSQTTWLQFESRYSVHLLSCSTKMLPVGPSLYFAIILFFSKLSLNVSQLNLNIIPLNTNFNMLMDSSDNFSPNFFIDTLRFFSKFLPKMFQTHSCLVCFADFPPCL